MGKPVLTIDELINVACGFCQIESKRNHIDLIGIQTERLFALMLNIDLKNI